MTIQTTDDRELSMKIGDEILSKLLDKSDVLELDEDTLAEHLLFIKRVPNRFGGMLDLAFFRGDIRDLS